MQMRHLTPPPSHLRISYNQLMEADRFIHLKMAEMTRAGIVPDQAGVRPLDAVIATTMKMWQVNMYLQPLAAAVHSSAMKRELPPGEDPPLSKRQKKTQAKAKAVAKASASGPNTSGKGAGKVRTVMMPRGLEGMVSRTADGAPICFGYNLGTCRLAVHDGKCPKGKHCCCKPNCFGDHSLKDCTRP